MRTPHYTSQFRRDVKRAKRRGQDMEKLRRVLRLLIEEKPLPTRLRDHPLKGDWEGCRDLHIERVGVIMRATIDIGSLIERRPELRGGRPIVVGTSVSVHRIVGWYKLGLSPEEIAENFSHLSLA